MESLSRRASVRIQDAFRPKTKRAYIRMFRVFVAFCVFMKVALSDVSIKVIVSFLECLVVNECSASMVANYMSAIKANFIVFDLNFYVCDHPKVKYFIKSIKINRPLSVVHHNIIDISMLKRITSVASTLPAGPVLKAIILTGFFAFLRLSNLCPHSAAAFDSSRHLTGADFFFTKKFVKLVIKWSKTIQTRDAVQIITLPKLSDQDLCPRSALRNLRKLYPMSQHTSMFLYNSPKGWTPFIDSKLRKLLKQINVRLGLQPSHFTFHSLRRSAATFAFNAHVPIQSIQRHGTWTSDCVWRYIQADQSTGEQLALSLADVIDN